MESTNGIQETPSYTSCLHYFLRVHRPKLLPGSVVDSLLQPLLSLDSHHTDLLQGSSLLALLSLSLVLAGSIWEVTSQTCQRSKEASKAAR